MCAQYYNKPVYVCAETHKFVDLFPLDQYRLPVSQEIINFSEDDSPPERTSDKLTLEPNGFVDYVPANLIKGFITEIGLLTPQEASEKVILMRLD